MTRVRIRHRKGRALEMTWRDPDTGKVRTRKCRSENRVSAEREAVELQNKIDGGGTGRPIKLSDFIKRCHEGMFIEKSKSYVSLIDLSLRRLYDFLGDFQDVNKIRVYHIYKFRKHLHRELSEETIRTYLRHMKAAFKWGKRVELLYHVPKIRVGTTKRCSIIRKKTVGNFSSAEIEKAAKEVHPDDYREWSWFIRGLWYSGLRLSEGLALNWDEGPFQIDESGRFPVYRILVEGQKSKRDELCPITPDFWSFLCSYKSSGKVFNIRHTRNHASNTISDILTLLVGERRSAHDLRRSFGTRWAMKVKPAVLMSLMRHKSIKTTMRYYVNINAESVAESLWST